MAAKLLNTITVPLRWMDLDAYGHVGNSRFFDFMTDARVDLFKSAGLMDDLSIQYVVVDAQCAFRKSVYYPGNLVIKQFCEKVGSRSFTLSYQFSMADDPETIYAEGSVVMVSYDAKQKKAVVIPAKVVDALN